MSDSQPPGYAQLRGALTRGVTLRITKAVASQASKDGLALFRDYLVSQDLSSATVSAYEYDISLFARWFKSVRGQEFLLGQLVYQDLTHYREHLVLLKRAPVTIKRKM